MRRCTVRANRLVSLFVGAAAVLMTAATVQAASSIRAVVNGVPITSNEIESRARLLRLSNHGATAASIQRAAMEELIDDQLKLQEAKRVGTVIPDAQVEQAFAGIAARLKITPAMLTQGLAQQGIDAKSLKSRLRVQMAWQQMVVGRFGHSLSISDSQVVDALAKKTPDGKAGQATGPATTAEYTLQQVVLVVAKQGGNPDARMREAEALRGRITSCDGLVAAVNPLSEAMVKSLGKRTEDELPEAFQGLLADVPVGRLSKPMRTPIGIEMIAVCGKREITGDFKVRTQVEDELRAKEGEVSARRYINDLRRMAVIEYKK